MTDSSYPEGSLIVRRCLVSGRVQGVCYRATAAERARAAGIRGHARNLPDGRVEVLACGTADAVREFIAWLWIGPVAARVMAVEAEVVELEVAELPDRFMTG
jgi:acylphosphatase